MAAKKTAAAAATAEKPVISVVPSKPKAKRHTLTTAERIAKAEAELEKVKAKAKAQEEKKISDLKDKHAKLLLRRAELDSKIDAVTAEIEVLTGPPTDGEAYVGIDVDEV